MSDDERLEEATRRIHSLIQELMNEGLLEGGMLQSWYLIGEYLDMEGDNGIIILSDDQARTLRALGQVRYAQIVLEEEVRRWTQED